MNTPLAERMRPKTLEEYVGQEHLVGTQGVLRPQIERGLLPSLIFWGPPGTGKTTLAHLIAQQSHRAFYTLSAISSGIKEVREVIEQSKNSGGLFTAQNPIVFIDEIHRFNKTQQDSLLQAVEKGWITLIGATTENPSFEVIPALLSRCQVYVLKAFSRKELEQLLHNAIAHDSLLKSKNIQLRETEALLRLSGGDGRKLLNTFELVVNATPEGQPAVITNDNVLRIVQKNTVLYDKTGEQHYEFIARRMLISASEDIGNANPTAMILANNTFQAVTTIGYPEARILLSQCAIYLASSPKSNASYMAINKAQQVVKQTGDLPVPIHLRNAPTQLMKELGYGKDYLYSHDYPQNFAFQDYLPEELQGKTFYEPSDNPRENALREALKKLWGERYGY